MLFTAICLGYLFYSIFAAARALPPNYYRKLVRLILKELLNVKGANVDASEIKSSYRQISRIMHPDKLSKYSEEMQENLTMQYVLIQQAYDALKNPTKRYIYDRFGPSGIGNFWI